MKAIAQAGKSYLLADESTPAGKAVLVLYPGQNKGLVSIDIAERFAAWGPVVLEPSKAVLALAGTEQKDVHGGMPGLMYNGRIQHDKPVRRAKRKKLKARAADLVPNHTYNATIVDPYRAKSDNPLMEWKATAKDGDGDGFIFDGTARMRPAPIGTPVVGDLTYAGKSKDYGSTFQVVADKKGEKYHVGPHPDGSYVAVQESTEEYVVDDAKNRKHALELLDKKTRGGAAKRETAAVRAKRVAEAKKKATTTRKATGKATAPKKAAAKKPSAAKRAAATKKTFDSQSGLPLSPTGVKPSRKYKPLGKPLHHNLSARTRKATAKDLADLDARGIKIQPAHKNIRVPTTALKGNGSFDYVYDHHRVKDGVVDPNKRRYTQDHDNAGQREKFKRVANIAEHISELDNVIRKQADTDDTVAAVALMRILAMRPSSDSGETQVRNASGGYDKVKTFGATSIQRQHITDNGDGSVTLSLTGKAAHQISIKTDDPVIVSLIQKRMKTKTGKPTDPFFETDEKETNKLIKSIFPDGSNKDLRTYVATAMAIQKIETMPPPTNLSEFKAAVKEVTSVTANQLQHGQPMSLASYVSPQVFFEWAVNSGVDYSAFENPISGRSRRFISIEG